VTVERGDGWELHLADWRDVELPRVDAVIEDPPYGERTHVGQRHERKAGGGGLLCHTGFNYDHLTAEDVNELCAEANAHCDAWCVWMMSHDLIPCYEAALSKLGRYVFAPLPVVIPGMNVRLAGDGPSNWTIHMLVSRTKRKKCWGTKAGAYRCSQLDAAVRGLIPGSKPLGLMEAIIGDYTDMDDLVLDRFAGGGTTGVAAIRTGRRFFGCERKPEHFAIAVKRLRAAREQMTMFGDGRSAAGAGE
jgi:hypothetical protein